MSSANGDICINSSTVTRDKPASRPWRKNIQSKATFPPLFFVSSNVKIMIYYDNLALVARHEDIKRRKEKRETFKTFIIFKIQPLLLHCSILLSLFTLKTNTSARSGWKIFLMFLTKIFFKKVARGRNIHNMLEDYKHISLHLSLRYHWNYLSLAVTSHLYNWGKTIRTK